MLANLFTKWNCCFATCFILFEWRWYLSKSCILSLFNDCISSTMWMFFILLFLYFWCLVLTVHFSYRKKDETAKHCKEKYTPKMEPPCNLDVIKHAAVWRYKALLQSDILEIHEASCLDSLLSLGLWRNRWTYLHFLTVHLMLFDGFL